MTGGPRNRGAYEGRADRSSLGLSTSFAVASIGYTASVCMAIHIFGD